MLKGPAIPRPLLRLEQGRATLAHLKASKSAHQFALTMAPAKLAPINVTNPENIAREPVAKTDALIEIPNSRAGSNGEGSRRDIRESTGTAVPVPSCVLTGKNLDNFALNDLDGQPWEFRKDHKGKLILIDFWGTWCGHCYPAIRHLSRAQ